MDSERMDVLNIMIQADSWGSVEAIENYLNLVTIPDEELSIRILEKKVGPLSHQKLMTHDDRNVIFYYLMLLVLENMKLNLVMSYLMK
eukprot:UN03547